MVQANIVGNAVVQIVNADGSVINSPLILLGTTDLYVESKDLDLGKPSQEKYIDLIKFDIEAPGEVTSLSVSLGYRDSLDQPLTWLEPETLELPNPYIRPRVTSKFFRVRFEDAVPLSQWKISRMEFYGLVMYGRL